MFLDSFRRTAFLLAAAFAFAPLLSAGPFADSARRYVDDGTIPGAVFLAADGEKILACEAVGLADIAGKKPMREDSMFWIASMTKPMTAAAFMMLVDEGKVSLDDPVTKYIPAFNAPQKIVPKESEKLGSVANFDRTPGTSVASSVDEKSAPATLRKNTITLRHLLSHTAGFPYSAPEEKPTLDLLPLDKAVACYAAGDLLYEPGTDYSYANTDINTVGRVIEIVSGMPYETFLQKRLLDPLGMSETTFWPDKAQLARIATSYKGDQKKRTLTAQPIALLHNPLDDRTVRYAFPGGGLFSTARDVARFGQFLLNKGVFNGKRLLSETAVAEMARRQTPPNAKTAYGLGINIQGADRFGHGGAYATYLSVWPEHNLVTVFMVQKISQWGGSDGNKIRPAFEKQAQELARENAPLITRSDWRMVSGGATSLYKFHADSTWEESWKGDVKTGKWKQTGDGSFSIGTYTFKIENDGAQLRRNDGKTWTRAAATPGRLAKPAPTPEEMRAHILTPPPPDTPRINGPRVFGARPGSVFLYTIPATGKRPLAFAADNLPAGLTLDSATGRITGRVAAAGDYKVTLRATNALGSATREFKIKIGDKLALTPPLGWSSWNAYGNAVSQENVLAVARAFVSTGLINHGWSYINIDDCWQSLRGGKHNAIQPNKKFPDMKKLSDEIHALGLKFGIYSGPWVGTYAGYVGSYSDNADGTYDWIKEGKHDANYRFSLGNPTRDRRLHYKHGKYSFVKNDVAQWVDWGVDYLKYDWSPNDVRHTTEMLGALRATDRDILYSLSNSAPYADAKKWTELTNVYRTTGDIRDSWESVSALGFNHTKWAAFSGPGHWADPDMLVVGHVGGWTGGTIHYTKLTADEQYTHISLWALLSAPMLLGCDMAQIDAFTLSLLTNDEVLDVNQDPLGIVAMPVVVKGDTVVYAKQLEDGSMAVGLFNKGEEKCDVEFTLKQLGLRGKQTIRDLWRQKDIAATDAKFSAAVNPHGVLFLKIYPGNNRE